jgi:hypothetical protein
MIALLTAIFRPAQTVLRNSETVKSNAAASAWIPAQLQIRHVILIDSSLFS